jgi:apolipoprotein N-acyltransferase
VGAGLLPWITAQTVIPLAGWLAPLFLLRFLRTQRPAVGLPLILIANVVAQLVSVRNGLIPAPPGVELYGIVVVMASVLSLGYVADAFIAPRLSGLGRTFVFPCATVSTELLLTLVSPYGLFGTLAYSQSGSLPLLQLISLTGVWGLTFVMTWGAAVANGVWERRFDAHTLRAGVVPFVAVMAAILLFGGIRLAFFPPSGLTVQIAALAPRRALSDALSAADLNLSLASAQERAAARAQYLDPMSADLFARTVAAARGGAKLVAWSEAAAFVLVEDEQQLLANAESLARDEGIYLQVAYIAIRATDEFPFVENRAVLIEPSGTVAWRYDKSRPVPGDGHVPGPGIIPTVDTPYGRWATIICFDADFPSLVRQAGRARADVLLVPSSDWQAVAEMHARMATFRALENGVALVRPTRQGISLAVDHQGRSLGYNADYFVADTHTLVTSVPTRGVVTLYTRIGDSVAYLSVVGLLWLGVLATYRRIRGKDTVASEMGGVA